MYPEGSHWSFYCILFGALYIFLEQLRYNVVIFFQITAVPPTDSLEVHDCGWRSSHEEPSLQVNPGFEHPLCGSTPPPAHRNTTPEQASRTLGPAQLPPAHHLQELQHVWTVVQCSLCHDRREGRFFLLQNSSYFESNKHSNKMAFICQNKILACFINTS